jgi:hypothetical protein
MVNTGTEITQVNVNAYQMNTGITMLVTTVVKTDVMKPVDNTGT